MPPSQNPKPRHVRPEVIARLRQRIRRFSEKSINIQLLLAARALHQKKDIRPLKMAKRNARASILANKYKMVLQIALRREGIENKSFYDEMNSLLFDLARTPEKKEWTPHQRIIFTRIEETLVKHGIERQPFFKAMENAMSELNAE